MSVLESVPDPRDGLTALERAVLIRCPPARAVYEKSAATVIRAQRVTGSPSTDLYDALVRMAQDFRSRYPLVDGQGNFGSIDDDPPAASRYTECRRTPLGSSLVGTGSAPDDSPDARGPLAGAFPSMLANGTWDGIATIPPHHLGELAAVIAARIDDPQLDLDGVLALMPGPDFPGGGVIVDAAEVRAAYATGKGTVRVRGAVHLEEMDPAHPGYAAALAWAERQEASATARMNEDLALNDEPEGDDDFDDAEPGTVVTGQWITTFGSSLSARSLVVTGLPWLAHKGGDAGVIVQVVEAMHRERMPTVEGIEDHSNRRGMRLVLELRLSADADEAIEWLCAASDVEVAIPLLFVALVDGRPRQCTLLELLDHYIAHQRATRTAAVGASRAEVDEAIKRDLAALAATHAGERRTALPAG